MESNSGDSSSDASSACASPAPQPRPRCSLCQTTSAVARPLNCTHAFCVPCMLRTAVRGQIRCPHCHRDDTAVVPRGSVDNVPEPAARDGASLRCTSCRSSRDNGAVAWCFDCFDLLCINCAMAHHFMRFFESHRFVPLVGETQGELAAYSHHRSDTAFCTSCNRPLCEECDLLEQRRETRRLEFPREAPPRNVEAPSSELERRRVQMRDLQAALRTVQLMSARLEAQYERAKQKVAEAYAFYLSVIEERRQAIMAELDRAYEESMASLRRDRRGVEDRIELIDRFRTIVESLTQTASEAEVLAFDELLESHLRELLTFQPEERLYNLEFVSNLQAMEAVVSNTFGYVDVGGDSEEGPPQHPPDAVSGPSTDGGSTPHENGRHTPRLLGSNLPSDPSAELQSGSGDPPGACALPASNTRAEMLLRPPVERQKMTYFCTLGEFGVMEGQFTEPSGVAVTTHNDIVVADSNNHCIQIFDRQCRFKRQFGEYGKRDGQLLCPNRVAVARRTGDIVVTERSPAHQIQVYTQDGQFVRKFGATILQHPRGVAVDNRGRMVVVESKVMRVTVFDHTGSVLRKFRCCEHLDFPIGVAVNDREEVFIADNRAHCVKVFSYDGAFIRQIGGEGITDYPIAVCINDQGEVVVADNHNNFHVTVFTQDGVLVNALESMTKHAQCSDIALMDDGSVVLASKDNRLYVYRYVRASTSSLPRPDNL